MKKLRFLIAMAFAVPIAVLITVLIATIETLAAFSDWRPLNYKRTFVAFGEAAVKLEALK